MKLHTDSCTWPEQCIFIEYESCNCMIPEKSGFESEEDRNYADAEGLDAYKPCMYYIKWHEGLDVITDYIDKIVERKGLE